MGLVLSVVISYAGVHEVTECVQHILSGVVPESQPDFTDLVDYYTAQLRASTKANTANNWTKECGQGYLYLTEDKNGKLNSAAVKYYDGTPNSTAILFSTKISSFGQETVDDDDAAPAADRTTTGDRSLDGIKFRPLQRSDPSGRRRSFRKRHSSSSNSSRESRASREEELEMFTSLEEAEFERMTDKGTDKAGFGSTPNLSARSHSRSRSRESSREARPDRWSVEAADSDRDDALKPHLRDVPKLNSFEEDTNESKEVIEEEDEVDFWGNSGD